MPSVWVDIDLDGFSDDEIREEFFARKLESSGIYDPDDLLKQMADAFYLNQEQKAVELAKEVADAG